MRLRGLGRRFLQNAIDTKRPVRSALRWPMWLVACARGKPVMARFETGGLVMQLVPRLHAFGTTSIFIKRDYYEPELMAIGRLIRPGDVVLDIGGSYGIFALFMAHFVGPEGHVYTFEPGAFSYSQLVQNIARNPQGERITTYNAAATDKPATLKLFHIADSPVNFSMGGTAGATAEEVPAVRVDATLPPEDAARIAFIKIDVEGYELAALEGARGILEASHPMIMFEVSEDALARQGQTPADIYGFLAGFGYSFWVLDGKGGFRRTSGQPEGNIFAAIGNLPGSPA
jgi:FkbM family methyltransferase